MPGENPKTHYKSRDLMVYIGDNQAHNKRKMDPRRARMSEKSRIPGLGLEPELDGAMKLMAETGAVVDIDLRTLAETGDTFVDRGTVAKTGDPFVDRARNGGTKAETGDTFVDRGTVAETGDTLIGARTSAHKNASESEQDLFGGLSCDSKSEAKRRRVAMVQEKPYNIKEHMLELLAGMDKEKDENGPSVADMLSGRCRVCMHLRYGRFDVDGPLSPSSKAVVTMKYVVDTRPTWCPEPDGSVCQKILECDLVLRKR